MRLNKVVVIGLGLIGGSLAAGLKKHHLARQLIGVARRRETCEQALALGVVHRAELSLAAVAAELGAGDMIFIAVPTLSVQGVLQDIKASNISEQVTITDGASVKGSVCRDVQQVFGRWPANFVPGHPIAGSEQSGVAAADAELYREHRVILTPVVHSAAAEEHIRRVATMWRALGADVVSMGVAEHDQILGATSHLPHVIAFSLVDTLAHDSNSKNIFRYAAGGFRDFTRIASSDAIMWRDIMLANKTSVLAAIDLFSKNLAALRGAVAEENATAISGVFTRAKVARDRFTNMLSNQAYSKTMQSTEKNIVYQVAPGGKITGEWRVPGDKSISHRSIMLGALAEGVTQISGFLEGEDALATLQAFRDMGVVIEGPVNGRVTVHGVGLHGLKAPAEALYLGNAGTAMRLLCGILAGQPFDTVVSGDESLSRRPMNRVAKPLRAMGARIETRAEGRPPLTLRGGQALTAINYTMPMASAQVKSCLLLAGLYAQGVTTVTEPAPTRDHTERMLRGFGYPVERDGATVSLAPGGKLRGTHIDVPADISSATFLMVAAAIAPGSDVTLTHVGVNPTRTGVISLLNLMGAKLSLLNQREAGGEPVADIRVQHAPLKGIEIPEAYVPLAIDEFPALLIAAACAEGTTVLSGAEELRVKETDRIQAMADGLGVLGIRCTTRADGIVVEGGQLGSGTVESADDHRIAMAFTIAALRASGPITVNNCANVSTSFPEFTELVKRAGISLEVIDA